MMLKWQLKLKLPSKGAGFNVIDAATSLSAFSSSSALRAWDLWLENCRMRSIACGQCVGPHMGLQACQHALLT